MSSGVFSSKKSSNRIELSQLVQDLLNFGVLAPCGSGEGAGGGGVWGYGGIPTHVHMHMNTHTCMHTHVYMYRNCKWPPTWRHPCLSCMCVRACMCTCMGHPLHTHTHPNPIHSLTTPKVGTPGISKNSITLELIKIFQFHLKI